jgi:undecaprenyl-phosphate galactose phosphotransferase
MRWIQATVDLVCLALAFAFGRFFRYLWDGRPLNLLVTDASTTLFAVSALFAVGWFFIAQGHYVRRRPFWEELRSIINTLMAAAAINAVLTLVAKQYSPVTQYLAAWSAAMLLIPAGRFLLRSYLLRIHRWQRPTVIVGTGRNAGDAFAALASEPLMGFQVVAFVRPSGDTGSPASCQKIGPAIPIEPEAAWDVPRLMQYQVVIALDEIDAEVQTAWLARLARAGHREVFLAPTLRGLALHGMEITHFFRHELLLMGLRNNLARKGPRLLKRIFDLTAAMALLVLLAPLFLWIAVRIRLTGSPVLFAHLRVGQMGRIFPCFKFRTMVADADRVLKSLLEANPEAQAEWNREFKLRDDPRITSIGRFLRRTSLDELPQIWNVLKGDMSLVGPRPVVPEELSRYGEDRTFYLQVRPGITGLWQVSGRNDVDYGYRVSLDSWYVRNWSLWYDLAILMKTTTVVFGGKGAY